MNVTDSEQRRNRILEVVIETYVSTAAPVGSAIISRRLRSSLSPATIRNIMVELEEAGLLKQPHTSAGRVPTERGYRFYVDSVMDARQLTREELRKMKAMITSDDSEAGLVLERVASVLAELSQQVAFVVMPTVMRSTVKQVELVPLNVRKLLCVLIANEEMIASHVVDMEEPMSRDEATALARFINTELVGLPCNELLSSLERRMLAEADSFYHFVKRSLRILQDALSTEPSERFFLEGTGYVLSQPEFSRNPRKAHELIRCLEAQEILVTSVQKDVATEGVHVRIGSELQVPGLESCSYLTAPFTMSPGVVGELGVLGPTRMDYQRMHSLIEGMGQCVSSLLGRWETSG